MLQLTGTLIMSIKLSVLRTLQLAVQQFRQILRYSSQYKERDMWYGGRGTQCIRAGSVRDTAALQCCSLTTLSWSGCCSAVVVYSPCPRADSNLATQHWVLVSRVSAYLSICSLAITAPVSHPSHTTVCGAGCMCALCVVALVAAAESLVSASVWNEELTTPRTVASGTRTEGLQCHFQ